MNHIHCTKAVNALVSQTRITASSDFLHLRSICHTMLKCTHDESERCPHFVKELYWFKVFTVWGCEHRAAPYLDASHDRTVGIEGHVTECEQTSIFQISSIEDGLNARVFDVILIKPE
jgi:hypothetical protein